jgi:hypothetical protein
MEPDPTVYLKLVQKRLWTLTRQDNRGSSAVFRLIPLLGGPAVGGRGLIQGVGLCSTWRGLALRAGLRAALLTRGGGGGGGGPTQVGGAPNLLWGSPLHLPCDPGAPPPPAPHCGGVSW